jgi:hypothetical protein
MQGKSHYNTLVHTLQHNQCANSCFSLNILIAFQLDMEWQVHKDIKQFLRKKLQRYQTLSMLLTLWSFLCVFLSKGYQNLPLQAGTKFGSRKCSIYKIAQEIKVLCPGHPSIMRDDDLDILSNWKSYVEELIKELRIVQRRCSLDIRNSGLYVYTKTPYALILEMIAENLIG